MSVALLGALVGSLLAGSLSDWIGRKPVIIISDFVFILGSLQMALADSIAVLMVGRIIIGLAVGVASMVVPVYLSEISPIKVRGKIVSTFNVAVTMGQLMSSFVALGCGRSWRLMLGLGAVPAFIQLVLMFFMPES